MKIVKIREKLGVLRLQHYILSFTSKELFLLCPLLKNLLHFIKWKGNKNFEKFDYSNFTMDKNFEEFYYSNFRKKTKHGVIESTGLPDTPYAYEVDIGTIIKIDPLDNGGTHNCWIRGYDGLTRDGYDPISISKHFGLNKESLARGKFRRSPALIEKNEYMIHFQVSGGNLARCFDKVSAKKLWMLWMNHNTLKRKTIGCFVDLCREEVRIFKEEEKAFTEYQRSNPGIIF